MKWKEHKAKWKNCTACPLHKTRQYVVLGKGDIPCDLLFIGEAPGDSEDTLGNPFVGPAGHLLDDMIERAVPTELGLRKAFTNIIACIPIDPESNRKAEQPLPEEIRACRPRLTEFIELARPRLILTVGKLSTDNIFKAVAPTCYTNVPRIHLDHPSYIIRAVEAHKQLLIRKFIINLRNGIRDHLNV